LQADLMRQLADLANSRKFDYIVIEASGICEPEPIARTIDSFRAIIGSDNKSVIPVLDCIVTVVDALRMKTEFECGDALDKKTIGEEDIENLIIQQIEFCNVILINKAAEVSEKDLAEIRHIIRELQPIAKIIECNYADVDVARLTDSHLFDFESVATSATWVREIERPADEFEHDHHHHDHQDHQDHQAQSSSIKPNHDHHHHHHHGEGEAEEYGISTFVYLRRKPFNFEKFDRFVNLHWPKEVIRTKGVIYFSQNRDMSLLFEQAGVQKNLREAGLWYATAPEDELEQLKLVEPGLMRDWDEEYGDRMIKLVFIGRNMNVDEITAQLDDCLEKK
nr:GTP-binding protein [Muribaculaceae bacterium]